MVQIALSESMNRSLGGLRSQAVGSVLVGALLTALVGCRQEHVAAGGWPHLEKARTYLDTAANETGFSGVVLIGWGEEVVFEEAYVSPPMISVL
jgi:hypothetical protein